jgi:hypothetical protein
MLQSHKRGSWGVPMLQSNIIMVTAIRNSSMFPERNIYMRSERVCERCYWPGNFSYRVSGKIFRVDQMPPMRVWDGCLRHKIHVCTYGLMRIKSTRTQTAQREALANKRVACCTNGAHARTHAHTCIAHTHIRT